MRYCSRGKVWWEEKKSPGADPAGYGHWTGVVTHIISYHIYRTWMPKKQYDKVKRLAEDKDTCRKMTYQPSDTKEDDTWINETYCLADGRSSRWRGLWSKPPAIFVDAGFCAVCLFSAVQPLPLVPVLIFSQNILLFFDLSCKTKKIDRVGVRIARMAVHEYMTVRYQWRTAVSKPRYKMSI